MDTALLFRNLLVKLIDVVTGGGGVAVSEPRTSVKVHQVVVLTPGELSTTNIYFKGRMEGAFAEDVRQVNVLTTSPNHVSLVENTLIVLVRYVPLSWLRWLEEHNAQLAGVIYFMDDDIPNALRARELPFFYALKTTWRYARMRRSLSRLCSEVWVSTPELVRRYSDVGAKLHEPNFIPAITSAQETRVYFYHGSGAHRREIAWLVPVVKEVQQRVADVWFEIIGTEKVRRLFHGIPRVRVIPPMAWPDYLAYAGSVRYQVGLAPCFDTDFNRARSHSKLFDITRLGAAGIYSNVIPYAEKVIHDQTGLLCSNETQDWVDSIVGLLQDSKQRKSLSQQALAWSEQQAVRQQL